VKWVDTGLDGVCTVGENACTQITVDYILIGDKTFTLTFMGKSNMALTISGIKVSVYCNTIFQYFPTNVPPIPTIVDPQE